MGALLQDLLQQGMKRICIGTGREEKMGQESVFLPERFAVREITLVETGRRERELLDIGQKDQGFLDPFGNPLQEGIHFL